MKIEHKERRKFDFISSVILINTTKTFCELINKSDDAMWGIVTTKITVNQISRMLLGELFTSRIGVFSFKLQFLWLLRIYFHQLNYLQLTDKRPPHVSFFFYSLLLLIIQFRAKKCMNEFETSSHQKNVRFKRGECIMRSVDDINFFIQQWNDFFTFPPTWWWI